MCELLAISSQFPTHTGFSLEKLTRHSHYDEVSKLSNPDGWGVAYYEDKDVNILREPLAANESKLVQFIEQNIPPTQLLILHIRKATFGARAIRNTHPFSRELGGCMHVFAHNGDANAIQENDNFSLGRFQCVGETDSEYAFCSLLNQLVPLWENKQGIIPPLEDRFEVISTFAQKLSELGPANFLYADSDVLFAHADKRTQDDGIIKPPGLTMLTRQCDNEIIQGLTDSGLNFSHAKQQESLPQEVTIIASVPLTDESWHPLKEGELVMLSKGRQVYI